MKITVPKFLKNTILNTNWYKNLLIKWKIFDKKWREIFLYPAMKSGAVTLFLIVFILTSFTIYVLKGIVATGSFQEGVLVEATGFLFDILLFGLAFTIYDNIKTREVRIQRYKDKIEFFRDWKSEEAAYRTAGNIKLLNKEKISAINLCNCYIKKANLDLVDLRFADLSGANLRGTYLMKAELGEADLSRADLNGADLMGTDLSRTDLRFADLSGANLGNANLNGADLAFTILKKVKLAGLVFASASRDNKEEWNKRIKSLANLQDARVMESNWIEKLKEWEVSGWELVKQKYVVTGPHEGYLGEYYQLKLKEFLQNKADNEEIKDD